MSDLPLGTFERTGFGQMLSHYNLRHSLPPTAELTQAYLMTQNLREAAVRLPGHMRNEIVGDAQRLGEAMATLGRTVLGNVGAQDAAANYIVE